MIQNTCHYFNDKKTSAAKKRHYNIVDYLRGFIVD